MPRPTFEFVNLNGFLKEFQGDKQIIECGVVATGPAAAYAEVWEWGNARQTKKGPKTVQGINPDGEVVWLSTQAPYGYINVHMDRYLEIVRTELGKVELKGSTSNEITLELKKTEKKIMGQVAEVISQNAPVDTGQLRDSFRVVEDGDPDLENDRGGSIESRFRRVTNIFERI